MASRGIGIDLSMPIEHTLRLSLLRRLQENTAKTDTCWLWMGTRRNGGHGSMSVHDRPVYVHQLAYALNFGPIPKGEVVCHRCDNRPCLHPDHLFRGTLRDNFLDMRQKGRGVKPPVHSGATHPMAHVTDEEVAEIRRLWAIGESGQRVLARRFGVSQSTIWRLAHGVTRQ